MIFSVQENTEGTESSPVYFENRIGEKQIEHTKKQEDFRY